jgi:hypothetical protein
MLLTFARRERGKVMRRREKERGRREKLHFKKISKAVVIWDSFNLQQSLQ